MSFGPFADQAQQWLSLRSFLASEDHDGPFFLGHGFGLVGLDEIEDAFVGLGGFDVGGAEAVEVEVLGFTAEAPSTTSERAAERNLRFLFIMLIV